MKIFKVEPGKLGYVKEIDESLESLQKEVDGYIQCCYMQDDIVAICDEEGRIKGKEENLMIPHYGVLVGNVIFVKANGASFKSLDEKDIEVLKHWY